MIVVSDTTPLISLMKINQLEILQKLFGKIIIPTAVYNELTTNVSFPIESKIIQNCDFITTVNIEDKSAVSHLWKTIRKSKLRITEKLIEMLLKNIK